MSACCDGCATLTVGRCCEQAICNLIRLASSPSSSAATPLIHGTPNNLVPGVIRTNVWEFGPRCSDDLRDIFVWTGERLVRP